MPLLTCGELFCGGGGWIANLVDILIPMWAIDNDSGSVVRLQPFQKVMVETGD